MLVITRRSLPLGVHDAFRSLLERGLLRPQSVN